MQDGPFSLMEEPILTMEEQRRDGVPSPTHARVYVTSRPVITAEAHVAYAGASQHTNNTAELSGIVESLCFLSSVGPVPRGSQACIFF